MKYKLIGLCAVLIAAFLTLAISISMPKDNGTRFIEHIHAQPKQPCKKHTNGELCTHLPIVKINTNQVEIPGRPIYDSAHKIIGYTTAADGNTMIKGHIDVIDNEGTNNHKNNTAAVSSEINIRLRGNSSRSFDKPNYYVKLLNSDGTNNPQKIMGMDAHHEWALHGPFLDKSLIRNYMCYNIAGEIMDYSPNVRFCEVFVNDKYMGLYVMTETITGGKDSRLSLEVSKKDNTFSGYILRLDRGDEKEIQNITPFTKYTLRTLMQHDIVYPGRNNITDVLSENIKDDFSFFEKALYSYDFDNEDYGYDTFIDVESFVDYFLINELTCNYDAGWMSTYMYKDIDGKYRMCVWDFNSAFDFYQDTVMSKKGFEMQNCLWYVMLFKDEDFTDKVIKRYRELRKNYFNEQYLYDFLDSTTEYLGEAIERNYEVWGYSLEPGYDMLNIPERNPRSHAEAISQIKTFLNHRIEWMDKNIETLRQYSAESKIKKFNEVAN